MRLIPGKTKVKVELFKGVSISDIIIGLIAAVLVVFVLTSNLPFKLYIILGVILLAALLLLRLDTEPNYIYLLNMLRHFGLKHKFRRSRTDRDIVLAGEERGNRELPEQLAAQAAAGAEGAGSGDREDAENAEITEIAGSAEPSEQAEEEAADTAAASSDASERAKDAAAETEEEARANSYDFFDDDGHGDVPTETREERRARLKAEKEEYQADEKRLHDRNITKEESDAIWLKRANQSAAKKQQKKAAKAVNAADMKEIVGFTAIRDDFIEYGGEYYGAVLEIPSVEFRFFSEHRRANSIENCFGRILRSIPADYAMNIVKIERPTIYDDYLANEYAKLDELRASYEGGVVTEAEYQARVEVLCDRITDLRNICFENKVIQPFYYLVLFDSDKTQLTNTAAMAVDAMQNGEVRARRLGTKDLAVFLKYTNRLDFDEREIEKIAPEDYAEWAMPRTVSVQHRTVVTDRIVTHNLRVVNYPSLVDDAWLAGVMSIPSTKVVVKAKPMDHEKAVRSIDHSLQELRGQFMATGVDSKRIELQEHIDTLSSLLAMLQGGNETLLDVNIYVTAYDVVATGNSLGDKADQLHSHHASINNMKRFIRRHYQEANLRLNNMEFNQVDAFIGSQVNAYDPQATKGRGLPSNSLAACFPWIFSHISDKKGIKLGASEGVPVFIDFFRRDSERVNSNMVIVGKSGSGKSYATKSLLTNLAADDSKIFILDPENEYSELANSLHGKFINVGNAQYGRLNPFHIITSLDDDESDGSGVSGSYATHLQFLEEFFRQILPDCDKDAMEYLNSLIDRMYTNMGITGETDLSALRPEDYPTFDDLYDAILTEFQSTDNEYIRTMLRTLMNYVAKFSSGGRNAGIWNGPSSVTTEENFTVFNFQSLLANRNGSIANAQMLLVLKYIDNEIIKNREYNMRHKLNRKVVVVIDEAHVFIDTKYPVALDFMFQLAKRIRKYNGMQIVITQNIKDFVGSEEIARKSTAIINACQYSFIFSLAPNDMEDLCRLYEKAGGINENEQEQIVSAPRGQAFTILSPSSRSTFKVEVPEDVVAMFEEPDFQTRYFAGEDGRASWEGIVGDSRALHDAAVEESRKNVPAAADEETTGKKNRVTFVELTEDEAAEEARQAALRAAAERAEKAEKLETIAAPVLTDEPDEEWEIPEIPDDPEEFKRLRRAAEKAQAPAEDLRTAPTVVVQAPASSGETEKKLAELLDKFSYDAMVEQIRRSVREELERNGELRFAAEAPAPAAPAAPAAVETVEKTESAEPTEPTEPELTAIPVPAAPDEEPGVSVPAEPETFPAPAAAETPDDAPEAEEDTSSFDIMKLLMLEAQKLDALSPIDMMVEYDEVLLEITLEELMQYNAKHV